MNFTVKIFQELLDEFIKANYSFQTVNEFVAKPQQKVVVLRHDVDKLPLNSLKFALIQSQKGIRGSYYFRINSKSFNKEIIMKIYSLGHEIGYHYETMDTCVGNIELAYKEFCQNLDMFRKIVPIQTICMHGSPTSKFDNRVIWDYYSYSQLDIAAEPYFDMDFNKVFYITDTGRRFDGEKVSIRDKPRQKTNIVWPSYHSTTDIIKALRGKNFPNVLMMTLHPQRWTNNWVLWIKELYLQSIKNTVKRQMVKRNAIS
jgi:hypothetical protein